MLLALKLEEGLTSQGIQAASRNKKSKAADSPIRTTEETQTCRPILDF